MLLDDTTAIVSGIGPGLGRDLAIALAREGADLVISSRTEARLAEVADQIRAHGRTVVPLVADTTSRDDRARLVATAVERLGRLDVLVNNAYHPGTYLPIERDDLEANWRAPFEVNVLGTMQLTQEAVKVMRKQGGGSIVMVSSMILRQVVPTMGSYAASKGALMAATQTMAREVGRHGIRVNSVVPGYIWGPQLQGYFAAQAKARGVDPQVVYDETASQIALGRIPTPEEIAGAVVFFASPLSRPITGQSLDVNGGHVFH